ncbi:LOW QUALITY PROTEIN: hypothetical protein OSB04_028344 [Centaurea solstitialis]|uniref:CCHC-type domain-containing protein n=1 Tax=Centaurea solstitialis TaxID=347529 RepID=A0AA38T0D9_9ASTR|nr:LOW QUALITY PROTEIN: hypothetical protein OSB04_028344 [Centaurea solstitialis]
MIVLRHERKWYVLEEPLGEAPPANTPAAVRNAHKKHSDDLLYVACLMLATMSPDLQARLINTNAYDMIRQLRDMFQTQARTERYDATKAFNECKMIKGTLVSDDVMKMKRHLDHLERLGHPVPLQLATDTILNSLSDDYKPFVVNYNMNNMEKSIAELHSMLKTAELNMGTKNKTKDVLMVRDGGVKKKHGHTSTSKGKGPVQAVHSAPKKGKGKGKGKKVKPNKARTENRCFTCNEVGIKLVSSFHSKLVRDNLSLWEHDKLLNNSYKCCRPKVAQIFDRVANIGRDPRLRLLLGNSHKFGSGITEKPIKQTKSLKSNLMRDTKDAAKGTSLALVSNAPQPSQNLISTVTITEIEDSRNLAGKQTSVSPSLSLLLTSLKPLLVIRLPLPVSNVRAKDTLPLNAGTRRISSLNPQHQLPRIESKGLIAEGKGWDESSEESSNEEDTNEVTCLMAIVEETEPAVMAQLKDIPEEEVPATPASTSDLPQVPTPSPSDTMTAMDALTIDLYNALNGKSSAEKLKECHEKLKELAVFEANQVHANQILCIEREQAIADREKALVELNLEKVTVKSWADASEKVDEIISSQRNPKNRTCFGFVKGKQHAMDKPDKSNLKFGMFITSDSNSQNSSSISKDEASTSVQPPKNSKGKNLPNHPPKPKKQNHKTPKVLGGGILGPGPAHLKFKHPKGPSKTRTYRNCYHCGQNDHIASKCPHATKAERAAKVKIGPKANKSAKGKKPLVTKTATIHYPVNTETSVKTDDVASTSISLVVYEAAESSVTYDPDDSSFADPDGPNFMWGNGIWYLDSGCSKHMTGNKHVLDDYKEEGPSKSKTYRNCYHSGQNDHIASKCPHATKAEKAAKVKKGPKANKSAKGKKPLVTETASIPDPVNTETSVKTNDVASTSTALVVYEVAESLFTYVPDDSSFADPDRPNFMWVPKTN